MPRNSWISRKTIALPAALLMSAMAAPASAASAASTGSYAAPAKASAAHASASAAAAIAWRACPEKDPVEGPALKGLECGTLAVPLDHDRPEGPKITLALTRARHTAARSQGVVLLNRGGPGAHGRDMPAQFAGALPRRVAAAYDWIGFDPRGVGGSRPALVCDKSYQNPGRARADTVPAGPGEELAWRGRARAFAADCAARYGRLLPHFGSVEWARDLDAIRAALRVPRLNYFGFSYGTYLGALYATMYPHRVRRMVLDSVVRPSGVWYENNLDQDVAFEKSIDAYFGWVARHRARYRLGRTAGEVERSYYAARARLAARPMKGRLGASELDETFLDQGYADVGWPASARALSDYVVRKDPRGLLKLWEPPTWLDQNNYTIYNAVQCRDAGWPRDWNRWHHDNWRLYRAGYRFETWGNAWYNAPCATWGVPGGPAPQPQGSRALPGILLVQATEDAATPYPGAVEMRRRFPSARLLAQRGGRSHGVTMTGDKCVDRRVAAYLATGALPPPAAAGLGGLPSAAGDGLGGLAGPDAACPAPPPPEPGRTHRGARLSMWAE